jgi:hypothetical protein
VVHHHVHNSIPLISILIENNPSDALDFYFSKIHFNIILPYTSRSSNKSCVLSFPAKIVYALLSHTCNIPRPYHSSRFGNTNDVSREVPIIKLFLMQSSTLACHIVPCSHTPSPYVLPITRDTKFHTHTKPQATLYLQRHVLMCNTK